jgi:5-methylcytosine-specific restriction endonuclease McrA
MSTLALTRDKIYKTVARQMHGVVPCWVCGEHVSPADATLEHIKPRSEAGNSHAENLAISHGICNQRRHAPGSEPVLQNPVEPEQGQPGRGDGQRSGQQRQQP